MCFVAAAVDGSRRVSSIGPSHFPNLHEQPCKAANIQVSSEACVQCLVQVLLACLGVATAATAG
jgi:hypothetical protein